MKRICVFTIGPLGLCPPDFEWARLNADSPTLIVSFLLALVSHTAVIKPITD